MPILKHAKKKLRQDKKRTILNKKVKVAFKLSVKNAKEEKNAKTLSAAFKGVDKAVKSNLIHKNKAARMKSALSKMVGEKSTKTASTKVAAKKTAKAVAAKPLVKKPTTKKKVVFKTK